MRRAAVLVAVGSVLHPGVAAANFGGRTGHAATGCGGCHGEQADPSVTVRLVGPAKAAPGQVVPLELVLTSTDRRHTGAGVNVASSGGILDAGPDTWVDDGELTHDRRQEMNDGRHVFAFAWTAPADPGPHLFWGAGNAVDAGGTARGDGWALAPVLSIEVDCALGACDGTDTAASAAADGVEPGPSGSATGCRTGPSPSGLAAVLGALWIAGRRPPRSRVSRLRRSPSASAP